VIDITGGLREVLMSEIAIHHQLLPGPLRKNPSWGRSFQRNSEA
jgi:hypothetical protein